MMMILAERYVAEGHEAQVEIRAFYLAEAQAVMITAVHRKPDGGPESLLPFWPDLTYEDFAKNGSDVFYEVGCESVAGAVHSAAKMSADIGLDLNERTELTWKLLDLQQPRPAQGAPRMG